MGHGSSVSDGLAGLEEMRRVLNTTKDKTIKRAAKAGINSALVPLVRAMRAAVNTSSASPELKRQARKTLAKRLKKVRGETLGKAGFGVGKQTDSKKGKAAKRSSDKSKRGVGISSSNIHWFVLGTADRSTKSGRNRGRIQNKLSGMLGRAASSSGGAMLDAARQKITEVLARETAKLVKKGIAK
jgi:hypothetical protein